MENLKKLDVKKLDVKKLLKIKSPVSGWSFSH